MHTLTNGGASLMPLLRIKISFCVGILHALVVNLAPSLLGIIDCDG
jgi:hypothetical protein